MEAAAQQLRHCERRTAIWGWVTIFLFLSGQYNHPWTLAPDYRPGLEWGQWTIHAMWWTLLIAAAYWGLLAVCFVQWLSWHDGAIRVSQRQPPLERTGNTYEWEASIVPTTGDAPGVPDRSYADGGGHTRWSGNSRARI